MSYKHNDIHRITMKHTYNIHAETLNQMQTYITNMQTSRLLKQQILYYILMTHLLTINHCLAQTIKMQTQGGNNQYLRMDYCADSASSARCVRARQLQSSQVSFCQQYIFTLFFLFGTNIMNKKG